MAICQFFLRGQCRFGAQCRNEHLLNADPSSPGSFGNQTWTAPGASSARNANSKVSFTVETIKKDLTLGDDKPSWPLSSYGPGKTETNLIQDLDESPEELRFIAWQALKSNNPTQVEAYKKYEQNKIAAASAAHKNGQDHADDAFQVAYRRAVLPPSTSQATTTAFGRQSQPSSTFGQPSVFGQPALTSLSASLPQPASVFGQALKTTPSFGQPTLGQSAQPIPTFGQPTQPASASAFGQSAFGQPANPSTTFGQPSFGQALQPSSSFGHPASGQTLKPSAFGQPAFGQPAFGQSAFGQISQSTTAFSQPSQPTSAFGQPSQPTSAFGQQSQPTSVFGLPVKPTSAFGQPVQSSAFGGGGISGAFGSSSASASTTSTVRGGFGAFASTGGPSAFGAPATQSAFGGGGVGNVSGVAPVPVISSSDTGGGGSAFGTGGIGSAFDMTKTNAGPPTALGSTPSSTVSAFGAPQALSQPSNKTNATSDFMQTRSPFDPAADPYASTLPPNYLDLLPAEARESFQSKEFRWGQVPEWVPPLEMR